MEKRERYELIYLFIREFKYKNKMTGSEFNFEPQEGTIYRAIRDNKGDTVVIPLDGIRIPGITGLAIEKFKDDNPSWNCDILEVTYENIKDIKIPVKEVEKVMGWEADQEENKRFLDNAVRVMNKKPPIDPPEEQEGKIIGGEVLIETEDIQETSEVLNRLMKNYIGVYNEKDGMAESIFDLILYVNSTYGDKYTDSPLDTKDFLYDKKHGKSVNLFSAYKYMARYLTEGYEKSSNPIDLFKAIHYLLFELSRLNVTPNVGKGKTKLIEGDRGDEGSNLDAKSGGSKTPKRTRAKRGSTGKSKP